MRDGRWGDVWNALIAALAHEPVELRILFWLVVAFLTVMALEGMRSSFAPRRAPKARPDPQPLPLDETVHAQFLSTRNRQLQARGPARLTRPADFPGALPKREAAKKRAKSAPSRLTPSRFHSIRRS